ncbi:MAG: WecB/TagA/CpsF family glycosyltransferase [Hydrococcus sp. Prado102]|jgi:exopolysaccharide biosynthesis WecB/TagA/CpsF family protein|nr:WecB/TagA/CpsF family glycosyltransferase [Hydrococcus sp. Prado102]
MKAVTILDIPIHNLSRAELLEKLNDKGGVVVTPNVHHLVMLRNDPELREAYQKADYRICDSKIVQYASIFLGHPIQEKISGSDLFPAFYEYNKNNQKIKIFLLGAQPGIAKQAQEKINQKVGREIVVETYSPPLGFEQDERECQKIIELIRSSGANVLALGLGTPKQEKWIVKYKKCLKTIDIVLAIGATIDFEAGHKPRSPKWMSDVGLEWFYRLICEPKRLWRRYLIECLPFIGLVVKQKLKQQITTKKSPTNLLKNIKKVLNFPNLI